MATKKKSSAAPRVTNASSGGGVPGKKGKKGASKLPRRLDARDVLIEWFANGHDAVAKLFESGLVTREAIQGGIERLDRLQPEGAALFRAWFAKTVPPGVSARRGPPMEGETRGYKVQQAAGGPPVVQLNVEFLKAKKGDTVYCTFERGTVVASTTAPSKARASA